MYSARPSANQSGTEKKLWLAMSEAAEPPYTMSNMKAWVSSCTTTWRKSS